jgi:endonuclease/exonuclease/phosphatase family metal-dependent hydrolase
LIIISTRVCVVATLLLGAATHAYLRASTPRGGGRSEPPVVRVLTYNIHHGEGMDGRFDLQRLANIMNGAEADLIALQEVDRGTRRANGVDQLSELARLTGMHPVFGKAMDYQGGAYGVAVLSRAPVRQARNRRLPGSPDREPRTALRVDVDVDEGLPRIQFTTTHLDQGRDLMDQVAQASYLAAGLSSGPEARILAGDMNTRPDTLTMAILARRWTDTFADPPPDANGRPRRRVDYVMVRPAASWRTVESRYIDAPLASDHQPVLVSLEWLGPVEGRERATGSRESQRGSR